MKKPGQVPGFFVGFHNAGLLGSPVTAQGRSYRNM
jgi:hypothetical protein